jgi:hypothetical protein
MIWLIVEGGEGFNRSSAGLWMGLKRDWVWVKCKNYNNMNPYHNWICIVSAATQIKDGLLTWFSFSIYSCVRNNCSHYFWCLWGWSRLDAQLGTQ